jgi:mono/diheme cytochrome c family protein
MIRVARVAIYLATAAGVGQHALAADPAPVSASGWTTAAVVATRDQPQGYVQFQNRCSVCHGSGLARPGTRALAVKYGNTLPALLEQRTDLTPETIRFAVRNGVTVMPPFRKTELSDADLNAVVAYLTRKRR